MANDNCQPSPSGAEAMVHSAAEVTDASAMPQDACDPRGCCDSRRSFVSATAPLASGGNPRRVTGTVVEDADSDCRANISALMLTKKPAQTHRVYRKRFYFVRHSQSQNNAVSLNDQAPVLNLAVPSSYPSTAANKRPGESPSPCAAEEPRKHRRCSTMPFRSQQRPCSVKTETSGATAADTVIRRVPDPPITELGRTQAVQAARWVQEHVRQVLQRPQRRQRDDEERIVQSPEVTRIVCSPMRRSVETACEISKVLQAEVYILPLLFEQGGLFRGPRKFRAGCRFSVGDSGSTSSGTTILDPTESDLPQKQVRQHDGSDQETFMDPGRNERSLQEFRTDDGLGSGDASFGMTLEEILEVIPHAKVIRVSVANGGNCHGSQPKSQVQDIRSERDVRAHATTSRAQNSLERNGEPRSIDSSCFREKDREGSVGGGYCPDWPDARRQPWWKGGRETLIQTVERARQVILWMEDQCMQAEEIDGSILMVMHGLMMDLLVKALFFPFPSRDSPAPYLDLLLEFLRHEEAVSGVPIYNLPQQAAYFPSNNCSFCCIELAVRPMHQRICGQMSLENKGCTPSPKKNGMHLRQPQRLSAKKESLEEEAGRLHGDAVLRGENCQTTNDNVSRESREREGVRLSFCANQEPRLVAALVQWNTQAVEPQLYTGHTLGASVLMSI
ncbi:phosphoglycerate mutase family protein [Toxoplasma gondii TgCatPRC2]|uniref:Phosphoglycerate mutase family protein n=1 Tax=Toxoplasma gondii TgCatPRC2 TaxID=1130821 RepID=A0A151HAH6_TOXGO|nr:phosphoglycerate mutase family protein [Toxoplasma gondii TgCatPRC2]